MDATTTAHQGRALWLSTIAFTICFAVWTIFSIIGIRIKQELGLNDTQFGLLVGTPILSGSLIRLLLGIWTDQYGGRRVYTVVMLSAAVATYMLTWADYLSRVSGCCALRRHRGRFIRGRRRLRLAILSRGQAGHRARHLRRRQRRRCTHQIRRALRAGGLWLADRCPGLGACHWPDGYRVLVLLGRRPRRPGAAREEREAEQRLARARAAEEHPGLAFCAVLFLRVRRLRRAGAVAAAISHQGLRRRYQDRRHGRCDVLAARQRVPGLWRPSLRSLRRTEGDVLDLPGRRRHDFRAVLSADRLFGEDGQRHRRLPPRNGAGAVHGDRVRARLLHGAGQGRRLQAHPGLLSQQCRRRRRTGRNDRRSRRLRASDCVRRTR